MPKLFKTIDEQLNILKSRGLNVSDDNAAKEFLKYNNYYRISGYSLTLRVHDRFYPNATMQNIIDIYNFDRDLRI
ncbi:MAG: Abi family protein, partial [Clostridia bacterium]|nr:Abi family protein [Clostridia bacterium]